MRYNRTPTLTINTQDESRFHMSFRLAGTDVSVANAIRRTMIAEVPTMAITLVKVLENTSALADEYIVHRLGLIPLHSENIDKFVFPQDCETCDDHCNQCSVTYALTVECTADTMTVTSRDLRVESTDYDCVNVNPVHDSGDVDPKPQPLIDLQERLKQQREQQSAAENNNSDRADNNVNASGTDNDNDKIGLAPGIVIARLSKGQKIHMKCLARKGIGKDHAKHSPMCTVSYRIFPAAVELNLDRINTLLPTEARKKLLDSSSGLLCLDEESGSLKYEQPFLRGRIAVHPDTCTKAGELAVHNGGRADEVITLNKEPTHFDFTAETTGAMTPRQALEIALRQLEKKAGDILGHLS